MLSRNSLKLRLILLACGVLLIAMSAAWYGLTQVFERHVEQRIQAELTNHLNQLIVNFKRGKDGKYFLQKPLSNPRFGKPFSGLYWQIIGESGVLLKSRSLWDFTMKEDDISRDISGVQEYTVAGPEGSELFSVVEYIDLDAGDGEKWYQITVSLDHQEITNIVREFSFDLLATLSAVTFVFLLALIVQVSIGLVPLQRMKNEIADLQHGKRDRLEEDYPDEILPVVKEINKFLKVQDATVERGRMRASNLAHGFKTPLSILSAEARRLENSGQKDSARLLRGQVSAMSQHVDRELAWAKVPVAQPKLTERTDLGSTIEKIVAALRPGSGDRQINWHMSITDNLGVQMAIGDFMEIFGNLLENACKWCDQHVDVRARRGNKDEIIVEVEDDGPGVAEDKFEAIMKRGTRLDQTVQGDGLGLAIVSDILNAYGYRLEAFRSALGGFGIRIYMR